MRAATFAAAVAATAAFASPALAAFTAKVDVSHNPMSPGRLGVTTVHVSLPQSNTAGVYRMALYVPNGYGLTLSQPAGTTIGTFSGSSFMGDLGGQILTFSGPITTAPRDAYAQEQTNCGVTTIPAAVWVLHRQIGGQPLETPLFVMPTSGTFTALGQYELRLCEPPGDVPSGTPGRATFGERPLDLRLTLKSVFTTPSARGDYQWHGLLTPYVSGTGTSDPSASVEAQAFVRLPVALSLTAAYATSTNVFTLSGALYWGGFAVPNKAVSVWEGASATSLSQVATVTTAANGTYSFSADLEPRQQTYFRTRANSGARNTACTTPAFPVPCVSATWGPWVAWSPLRLITP